MPDTAAGSSPRRTLNLIDREEVVLSDILNRVLDRGVIITGSVMISVADVDLVRLDLGLMLTSVETARALDARGARQVGEGTSAPAAQPPPEQGTEHLTDQQR